MATREIVPTEGFARSRKRCSKKNPGLDEAIADAVNRYAAKGPTGADQIPNLNGCPVFKERLRPRNRGSRGGARIIFYCDDVYVVPLFLYMKSDREDVPPKEIISALKEIGLYRSDDE